jgi:hypothetical protein
VPRRTTSLVVVVLVLFNAGAFWFLRDRMTTVPDPSPGSGTSSATTEPVDASTRAIEGAVLLVGAPDGSVLRAARGECASDAREDATVWVAPGRAAAPELVEVDGLVEGLAAGRSGDRWWIIGTDESCAAKAWQSTDLDGIAWRTRPIPEGAWYLEPNDPGQVVSPQGPVAVGDSCQATSLQTVGTRVAVVCSDGRALVDTGPGDDFVQLPDADVAALAIRADGRRAELISSPACLTGLRVTAGQKVVARECFRADADKAPLGIAWAGDDLVAQIGYDLRTNAGGEWKPRG